MITQFKVLSIVCLTVCAFSCKIESPKPIKSFDIEFDGGKSEFYDKYNLWLSVTNSDEVEIIKNLIRESTEKVKCNNTSPVMWEIDVFAIYENEVSKHQLTLGSSTYNKESLRLGNRGCFQNVKLVTRLKELMMVDSIKKYNGKMRQPEFDRLLKSNQK